MIDQTKKLREMVHKQNNSAAAVPADHTRVVSKNGAGGRCSSIAILSGKGGVGKSVTAIILGRALTQLKKKVLIFDGDFGLANLHILLGIAPKFNLSHFIQEKCSLSDILYEGPRGITIIPGSSGLALMADLEMVRLEYLIKELSKLESQYDFLLIDSGAGIGHTTIQLSCSSERALIVVVPEPTSLADAYATIKVLASKRMQRIFVVVNMAHSEKDGKEIFSKLSMIVKNFLNIPVELVGILPFDKDIAQHLRAQKSITEEKLSSRITQTAHAIALRLCNITPVNKNNFFSRLLQFHHSV
jgi:flagellar biosynthesis protein FlhG